MNVIDQINRRLDARTKMLRSGIASAHDAVNTPKRRAGALALDAAKRSPNDSLVMKAIPENSG